MVEILLLLMILLQLHPDDIVKFIIENRRGHAYKNYSVESINAEWINSIRGLSGAVSINESLKCINGVVTGEADEKSKTFFVRNILTTEPGIISNLLSTFKMLYPTFTLTAKRHGRRVVYTRFNRLEKLIKSYD